MNDEKDDLIEEEELDGDFIDDFEEEEPEEELDEIEDDISEGEIVEEPEEIVDIEEDSSISNQSNEFSNSYTKPNNNINETLNTRKTPTTNNLANNGYSPNSLPNKNKNEDLKNAANTVASVVGKGSGGNNVPPALSDKKMNVSSGTGSTKSENVSVPTPEKSESGSENKSEEKSDVKEKVDQKVNEAKNDAMTVAKGAAEIAAGNKVQGIIDLAPLFLKQLKKKIILYVSMFFISFFALAAIFFAILGPMQDTLDKLKEFWDGVTEFSEKTNNMYSGLGFKTTEQAFYEELDDIYNDNFSDINLALIMSALYYPETDNEYETDYSKTEDSGDSFLSEAASLVTNPSDDTYTQGKILRARMLAKGMTEEVDGEEVTLEEFIRLYREQMAKDTMNLGEPLLGVLLNANPMSIMEEKLKELYNIIFSPEFVTSEGEFKNALSNILETATLGFKTVTSVKFRKQEGSLLPEIYVTMKIKAYDEEKFKQFLATKYIPKMPEYKKYIDNLTGNARDEEIERIVKDIYERESWYTDVYGMVEGNVENNDSTCVGAIDNDVVTELAQPVKVGDSVSFDGEYAYGISNGKLHNGVDLNETTSGTKAGDDVFAVANGKVIEIDMSIACNTTETLTCSENGSYVALLHDIAINGETYTFVTLYANLKSESNTLKVGDKVKKGDKIGVVGNTGNAKVPQLHFAFLKGQSLENGTSIDPSNLFISCNIGDLSGESNAEKIWFYFRNLGYSEFSTAAAMGNIAVETADTFDSRIVQGDIPFSQFSIDYTNKVDSGEVSKNDFMHHGPNGGGYGLVQFTYYSRKETLYNHAKETSTSVGDLKTQLETIMIEFEGWKSSSTYKTWKECSSESQLDTATLAFMKGYERPGTPHEDRRKKNSHEIYKTFHGRTAPSTSSVSSTTGAANMNHQEKLKIVFPNGVPQSAAEVEKYLVNIEVPITTKEGKKSTASVQVHKAIAGDVKKALTDAQNSGFKVYQIGGYRAYGSDSAGKVRDVGLVYSQHCYGLAVDINVNENCYKPGNGACTVGSLWNPSNQYSITTNSALYKSFKSNGWGWGGEWNSAKDYMHFSFFGT